MFLNLGVASQKVGFVLNSVCSYWIKGWNFGRSFSEFEFYM